MNNPRALLDAWSTYQGSVRPKAVRHYYVRSTTPPELQRRLDHACQIEGVPYKLTGISAGHPRLAFGNNRDQKSRKTLIVIDVFAPNRNAVEHADDVVGVHQRGNPWQ